jgi:hypothetical protein
MTLEVPPEPPELCEPPELPEFEEFPEFPEPPESVPEEVWSEATSGVFFPLSQAANPSASDATNQVPFEVEDMPLR